MAVANFHREMIKRAHDAIESSPPAHRDISGITVALSEERFRLAKEKIQAFRRELHDLLVRPVEQAEYDEQTIYQINFQLFNLSEVKHA